MSYTDEELEKFEEIEEMLDEAEFEQLSIEDKKSLLNALLNSTLIPGHLENNKSYQDLKEKLESGSDNAKILTRMAISFRWLYASNPSWEIQLRGLLTNDKKEKITHFSLSSLDETGLNALIYIFKNLHRRLPVDFHLDLGAWEQEFDESDSVKRGWKEVCKVLQTNRSFDLCADWRPIRYGWGVTEYPIRKVDFSLISLTSPNTLKDLDNLKELCFFTDVIPPSVKNEEISASINTYLRRNRAIRKSIEQLESLLAKGLEIDVEEELKKIRGLESQLVKMWDRSHYWPRLREIRFQELQLFWLNTQDLPQALPWCLDSNYEFLLSLDEVCAQYIDSALAEGVGLKYSLGTNQFSDEQRSILLKYFVLRTVNETFTVVDAQSASAAATTTQQSAFTPTPSGIFKSSEKIYQAFKLLDRNSCSEDLKVVLSAIDVLEPIAFFEHIKRKLAENNSEFTQEECKTLTHYDNPRGFHTIGDRRIDRLISKTDFDGRRKDVFNRIWSTTHDFSKVLPFFLNDEGKLRDIKKYANELTGFMLEIIGITEIPDPDLLTKNFSLVLKCVGLRLFDVAIPISLPPSYPAFHTPASPTVTLSAFTEKAHEIDAHFEKLREKFLPEALPDEFKSLKPLYLAVIEQLESLKKEADKIMPVYQGLVLI